MTSAGAGRASHVFLTNHKTYPSSVRSQVLAQAKYWPAPIKKMMPDAGSRKNLEGEQGNKIPVWTHSYHLKIYYQMFEYIELEWHNSNKQSNLPAWNHPRLQNNSSHICWDHIARQKKCSPWFIDPIVITWEVGYEVYDTWLWVDFHPWCGNTTVRNQFQKKSAVDPFKKHSHFLQVHMFLQVNGTSGKGTHGTPHDHSASDQA